MLLISRKFYNELIIKNKGLNKPLFSIDKGDTAIGQHKLGKFLDDYNTFNPIPEPLHEKLHSILKLYFYIGEMPEAVSEYIKSERLRGGNIELIEITFRNLFPIHCVIGLFNIHLRDFGDFNIQ